jgi:hypothetical protein
MTAVEGAGFIVELKATDAIAPIQTVSGHVSPLASWRLISLSLLGDLSVLAVNFPLSPGDLGVLAVQIPPPSASWRFHFPAFTHDDDGIKYT